MWIWAVAFAEPLTLQQAWQGAVEHNLELQGQSLELRSSRWRLVQARGGFDPQLSLSAGAGGSQTPTNNVVDGTDVINASTRRWSAGLSQALPTGGSLSASYSEYQSNSDSANAASNLFANDSVSLSLQQPLLRGAFSGTLRDVSDARLGFAESELRWRSQLEQLVLDVADGYWGLLSARERKRIAERSVTLADQQLADTLERQTEGFAGSGDVLQVQVSAGQARRQLVDAEAAEGAAQLRLARILGRDLNGDAIEIADRPEVGTEPVSMEEMLNQAREGNARLQIARVQLERARRNARGARNDALPDLSVNADVSLAAGGVDPKQVRNDLFGKPAPSWGVGVNLGLPLLLRSSRARYGMAAISAEQAELTWRAAEQDLHLRVDAAVRNLRRDRAGLSVALQTLEHANASLAAQQELLSEGRGRTRDVVDALESLRSAEASELDARIACQASQLALERVVGTLLESTQ